MNLSGEAVAAVVNYYRDSLNQVLIIHDEMGFAAGRDSIRLPERRRSAPLKISVSGAWKPKMCLRLRVGIGRCPEK